MLTDWEIAVVCQSTPKSEGQGFTQGSEQAGEVPIRISGFGFFSGLRVLGGNTRQLAELASKACRLNYVRSLHE
jgi:hypothetical protein